MPFTTEFAAVKLYSPAKLQPAVDAAIKHCNQTNTAAHRYKKDHLIANEHHACMMDTPALLFVICLVTLSLSAQTGAYVCNRRAKLNDGDRADLGVILTATLTLLGLIIGFTFSMAITRYDQRKDYEASEANAIGTEFVRAGLLPTAGAARVRERLRTYLNERVLFYTTRDVSQLQHIDTSTTQLQMDLWSAVQDQAAAQQTPIAALVASGMNDVLNSQAYTQAAWWNRIPIAAWVLMEVIAMCSAYLLGYTSHRHEGKAKRFFVLPLIVSISFFLIADIDSPRGGTILVHPRNLESLSRSLRVH